MRSLRLFGVLLCTLFAINVPVAWATQGGALADCDGVTFQYKQWVLESEPIDVTEIIEVDGTEVYRDTLPIGKPPGWGPEAFPHNVPYPGGRLGAGTHTVVAKMRFINERGILKTPSFTMTVTCTPICTPGQPDPADANATGDAFGAYVNVSELIKLKMRPKVTSNQHGSGTDGAEDELLSVTLPEGFLNLNVLQVSSQGVVTEEGETPSEARDISTAEVANLKLLKGMIEVKAVRASAEAIATGTGSSYSSAGSTFEKLIINGVQYNNVAPNTRVNLPRVPGLIGKGSYVVLHERIASSSAPAPGVLAGGRYSADIEVNMIHVFLKSPLGLADTEITVAHASAHADFAQIDMCPGMNDGNTVSGHAFTASASLIPTPDFDLNAIVNGVAIEPTGGTAYVEAASVNLPGPEQVNGQILGAGVAQSYSTGTVGLTSTDSTSYANVADVNLFGGMVKIKAVKSQCASTANADGASSNADGTVWLGFEANGQAQGGTPPPNTTIPLGPLGYIVLNEQIPDAEAEGHTGITVRAVHAVVPRLGLDVRVAEAHCDATFNAPAP